MSSHTLEGKKKTQNGVKRLMFTVLSILLEVVFLVGIFKGLNEYAVVIDNMTRIFAVILVLKIYGRNETSSMKTPWIILILTLPILGVALYFLIGLNGGTWKMRMRYKKIDEKLLPLLAENKEVLQCLNASDPKAGNVSNYIERNACYPVYQNTDVIYFDEAVKGLEAQLADLAKAEQFIFMEYHAIEDEYAWSRIQTVLEERVKAGVEVRVFYDDMGSIGFVNLSFARKLEAKGIACRVFNPLLPGLNMFLNNRDHRKITVVDGKVGYTGGYNLANEYFNYTHPYGEWKDTGIRLEGDAVASLTAAFLEMWESSGKTPAGVDVLDIEAQKKYLVQHPYQAQQTGYIQPYADCPLDGIQVGEDVYISIVNKADRYCWFMTPYLIITDEMTHALSLAAKRGVDVRIITPGIPDKKLIYSITRSFYHNLVQDGVRIYEWTPGFCHAKMSVADDCMATCGTINLDYLNSRKEPYLHIGQPIESYGFLDREKIYPTRTVKGEKTDILTGAFRQGSEENLVVFSDEYFEKVQDDWKKYNWITGDLVEEGEAEEGVTIHHWPTKLVLLNVKNADYQKIEKELLAFRKVHKEDERFDKDVLSCYSKRTTMEQIESERFMTTVVDIFIMGAFLLGSVLVIYLKYESEMTDKKKRNHFLTCIGMSSKEREKLIRTETGIFFWIPAAVAVVMVPVLTGEIWNMREYTKADCVHYLRYLLILAVIYLVVQGIGVKVIEQYTIRKVEGKHERNIKGK